ncbi:hypothetical protein F110043I8_01780 [Ruminococcus sp. f11]
MSRNFGIFAYIPSTYIFVRNAFIIHKLSFRFKSVTRKEGDMIQYHVPSRILMINR